MQITKYWLTASGKASWRAELAHALHVQVTGRGRRATCEIEFRNSETSGISDILISELGAHLCKPFTATTTIFSQLVHVSQARARERIEKVIRREKSEELPLLRTLRLIRPL